MKKAWSAKWIKPPEKFKAACPEFEKHFVVDGKIISARLYITAIGVYEASLNGKRIGEFVLAPGWTSYNHRLQYQEYDVTDMLANENLISVTVGKGWYRSNMHRVIDAPAGIIAQLELVYANGATKCIISDEAWSVKESNVRFAEIYDGEIYDASFDAAESYSVCVFDGPSETLIPQEGEEVREQERLLPVCMFTTPEGDRVIDFGQNITGYVETSLNARTGDIVKLSFAEVLDNNGNFYNQNYRLAKSYYSYTCKNGIQTYKPTLTFYGFRYVRIDEFPGGASEAVPENFTAIAVYSDMRRTGRIVSSDLMLNRLFENAVWGQKGNFLDIPTDCPQRDERLGWTGDAQVFIRTACLNFDVERFFSKWLADMAADQAENGLIDHVIPAVFNNKKSSAAWGDAATVCPWELYLAYGNKELLAKQFPCMKKWVDYITSTTTREALWFGGSHYGDWLALDAPFGSFRGSSRDDFVASAFYAHSTELLVKAGHELGYDMTEYEELLKRIHTEFRKEFSELETQTECVLAAHFKLTDDVQAAAARLAKMIRDCGGHLQTGFVGTPYLLYVLSDNGYTELAYDLLLRREYPSWLYSVTKGATTIWEHWDGITEDGGFWNKEMNSFNHYAYGSVLGWVYNVAAGIKIDETAPGYAKLVIEPHTDVRLDMLEAELDTRHGHVRSRWEKQENFIRFEIDTPVEARITINNKQYCVSEGKYIFFSEPYVNIKK